MSKTRDYKDGLHERLRNQAYAIEYLQAVLQDAALNEEHAAVAFLLALRDVAEAHRIIGATPTGVKHDYSLTRCVGIASDSGKSEQKTALAILLEEAGAKADDLDVFVNGISLGNQLRAVVGQFQRTGDVAIPTD